MKQKTKNKNIYAIVVLLLCIVLFAKAQTKTPLGELQKKMEYPRLVVGIVVDQMRYDYLLRFYDRFEEGGFKRLMDHGYQIQNAHYNYIPTKTGPGHASVYTGSTPMHHGIIGNGWYDRSSRNIKNCVEDTSVTLVGSDSKEGKSPSLLLATTITDELKLNNEDTKVIGISLKDRAAILPAGHLANGAYWYDDTSGKFVTSTYYMKSLPDWLENFNNRSIADSLMASPWKPSHTAESYIHKSRSGNIKKTDHKKQVHYDTFITSPHGNTILRLLALETIKEEKMGKDSITDFLAVSFSSTDKIGHKYGPHSSELEDTYLRLDHELALIFDYLDKNIGNNDYLVFLTADHGASDEPAYLMKRNIPAGYYDQDAIRQKLNKELKRRTGIEELVLYIINEQVYFDRQKIEDKQLSSKLIFDISYQWLLNEHGVAEVITRRDLMKKNFNHGQPIMVQRGYNAHRSGDLQLIMKPAWIQKRPSGTDHGSGYSYDTHVPLLWYGWNIPTGKSFKYHPITDIAPTLSELLHLKWPSATTGQLISEMLKR